MRDFAKSFYKSKMWQKTRDAYSSSVGGLCEICLGDGIYRAGKIVHHKIEITPDNIGDPNVSLNWNNLQLLCRDCHAKAHGNLKRYRVDEIGRVVIK